MRDSRWGCPGTTDRPVKQKQDRADPGLRETADKNRKTPYQRLSERKQTARLKFGI